MRSSNLNTIFIIVVLVSLKTEGQYTCTLLFCTEHRLTTAGARIISRNLQCFLEIPVSLQPHPPVHISLKTIAFPSCFIIDDKVNESTLQNKTPTIIYYEYHCICSTYISPSHLIFSVSFCGMRKWNNYFRDGETQLHKICPENTKLMEAMTRCELRIHDNPPRVVFIYKKLSLLREMFNKAPEVSHGAPETRWMKSYLIQIKYEMGSMNI